MQCSRPHHVVPHFSWGYLTICWTPSRLPASDAALAIPPTRASPAPADPTPGSIDPAMAGVSPDRGRGSLSTRAPSNYFEGDCSSLTTAYTEGRDRLVARQILAMFWPS